MSDLPPAGLPAYPYNSILPQATTTPPSSREHAHGADPRHAILREMGLSDYMSRAYLALLELGEAEARDVSRLGKVPIAKVYSTLDQLAHKGFCVVLPETPKRYAPEPMERIMQRIERAHVDEAARARARAAELAAMFPVAPKDHAGDRGSAVVLRGRAAMLDKGRQLARSARDILVLGSDGMLDRERLHLDEIAPGTLRLLQFAGRGAAAPRVPAGCEMRVVARVREAPFALSFRAYDDEAVLLCHHVPDDRSGEHGQDSTIVVTEQALVRGLRDVMELVWASARRPDDTRPPSPLV